MKRNTQTRTVYVTVATPSDGVVPDYSAKAMPGVQTQCIVEAKHTNHRQLLDSHESKNALDNIFKGYVQDSRNSGFLLFLQDKNKRYPNSMKNKYLLLYVFIPLFFVQSQCRIDIATPINAKTEDTIPKLEYDANGVKIRMPYLWKTKTNESLQNSAVIKTSVVFDNKVLVKGEIDNMAALYLLNIKDGSIVWEKKIFNTSYFSINDYGAYQYNGHLVFTKGSYYNLDILSGNFLWKKSVVWSSPDLCGMDSLFFIIAKGNTQFNKDSIYGVFWASVNDGDFKLVYVPDLGKVYFNDRIKLNGPGGIETVAPYRNSEGNIMLLCYIWSGKDSPAGNSWIDLYNFSKKKFVFQYDTIQGSLGAWPPLIYNNRVYHTIGDTTGVRVQCIDLTTKKVVWSHETGLYTGLYGSVIAEGKLIFVVGDMEKYMMALDLETGAVMWRTPTSAGSLSSKMSYLNGVVYFCSVTDAKIHAFEAATGKELWNMDTPDYPRDYNDYLSGWFCVVVPGKNGEKGKVIVVSQKHAYCFEAER